MIGTLLNDYEKLKEELPMLKTTTFNDEVVNSIIAAIQDTESVFKDIQKHGGLPLVAYAMKLSNICANKAMNVGYEK